MSWVSWICFGICASIAIYSCKREVDILSPAKIFGFIWSLALGLAELKFSAFQHIWNFESWTLLLIGITSFLVGTFIAYVLNLKRKLVPIDVIRMLLKREKVHEAQLFKLICLSVAVYGLTYLVSYLVKGYLPIFVVGTKISRVDFNIYGFGILINSIAFIIYFTLLYFLSVNGNGRKKTILVIITVIALGSYFLLLQRFQIIMAFAICFTLLYYASNFIRLKTAIPLVLSIIGFFYWITSLRYSHAVTTIIYSISKMKFSKDFAILTEPYMYIVMNLENFAHSVNKLEYHTYGYFTFDFIGALTGLKYWILNYFNLERTPYLFSSYNTYTAFWWFYCDFGTIGLALIPFLMGITAGMVYYQMRSKPSIKSVTAYGVVAFTIFVTYFNFPLTYLWFHYNLLALYLILRWTIITQKNSQDSGSSERSSYGGR